MHCAAAQTHPSRCSRPTRPTTSPSSHSTSEHSTGHMPPAGDIVHKSSQQTIHGFDSFLGRRGLPPSVKAPRGAASLTHQYIKGSRRLPPPLKRSRDLTPKIGGELGEANLLLAHFGPNRLFIIASKPPPTHADRFSPHIHQRTPHTGPLVSSSLARPIMLPLVFLSVVFVSQS